MSAKQWVSDGGLEKISCSLDQTKVDVKLSLWICLTSPGRSDGKTKPCEDICNSPMLSHWNIGSQCLWFCFFVANFGAALWIILQLLWPVQFHPQWVSLYSMTASDSKCTYSIPFTPESDQCQNSPAASQEIWHHTVWRTWLFIAYSDEKWLYYKFSLHHSYNHFLKGWENTLFELRSDSLPNVSTDTDEPVQLNLPNQWLWDIVDEFIYQVNVPNWHKKE